LYRCKKKFFDIWANVNVAVFAECHTQSPSERSIYAIQKALVVCAAGSFAAATNLLRQQINRSVYVDAAVDLLEQGMKQLQTIGTKSKPNQLAAGANYANVIWPGMKWKYACRFTWVVLDKGPLNGCVCVCVCVHRPLLSGLYSCYHDARRS